MGAPEIGAFLSHLAVTEKVAASTQNQAPHTLRHCFATHLLEVGCDIRTVH